MRLASLLLALTLTLTPTCASLQVKSLYGPLLAIVQTSKSASQAMVRQHSPDGTREAMVAAIRAQPEGPEGVAYR